VSLAKRLEALNQVYQIYDDYSAALDLACEANCAHCCTANVTMTTLEACKIMDGITASGKQALSTRLNSIEEIPRFKPLLTTNRMAELCAASAKLPAEDTAEQRQDCALLDNDLCTIYDLRPFGCRCFVSRQNCGELGYADIDDFTASVNTVFLQVIEHLDAAGCSGNLIDVLGLMILEDRRRDYEKGHLKCMDHGLIVNWELKVLMIPPEHRLKMAPLLKKLNDIKL
jgi:Fe-S-cluster containining protein